jgi:tetratricopeptide (TPR) repeat protein
VAEEVLLLRAEIALNQGELDGAAHLCQRILDSDPLSVHGHFLLGLVCWTRGDERTAIEEFKKVVYLRGDNVLARFYLGDLYALGGQVDEAKREYANAVWLLEERPESFDARFAGGFSPGLLIDTCRSRLQAL